VKMRGTIKPTPVYPQDIPGLLAWLNQPPSQWSAVGWQNAPAWAALIVELMSDLREAEADRDHARRMYCRAFVDLVVDARLEELSLDEAAAKIADDLNWDCFEKDEANP
jgi:hypothetical protein